MTFALQSYVHEWPQFPQFWGSDAVSIHVPVVGLLGHSATRGGDELHVHWEAVQVPSPQERPQAPQLRGSVLTSTHDDPHMVWVQSELDESQAARTTRRTLARIRSTGGSLRSAHVSG